MSNQIDSLLSEINQEAQIVEFHKNFVFELKETPDSYEKCLSIEYAKSASHMAFGVVRCSDEDEAIFFLTILRDRLNSGVKFDYGSVAQASTAFYEYAMHQAAYKITDDDSTENMPFEGEVPGWLNPAKSNYYSIFTADWGSSFVCIPTPKDSGRREDKSLPFKIIGIDSEAEVQTDGFYNLEVDSLEWFLWCQTFCHNKNLLKEKPGYGYFHYQIIGAAWITPEPENLKNLYPLLENPDFLRWLEFKDVTAKTLFAEWLEAVEVNCCEDHIDEDIDEDIFNHIAECKKNINIYLG
jgi:hypothetical protein